MGDADLQSAPRAMPAPYRAALVLPLAFGVLQAASALTWALGEPGQAPSFYLANAALSLLPILVYTTAGVLLFRGGSHRRAWSVLLACGVAISAWYAIGWLQFPRVEFGGLSNYFTYVLEPLLVPLYLSVLAAAHVLNHRRRRPPRLSP